MIFFLNLLYSLLKYHSNHSVPNPGTLYSPHVIKIPILASSYHCGVGRVSKDAQSAVYSPEMLRINNNAKITQKLTVRAIII